MLHLLRVRARVHTTSAAVTKRLRCPALQCPEPVEGNAPKRACRSARFFFAFCHRPSPLFSYAAIAPNELHPAPMLNSYTVNTLFCTVVSFALRQTSIHTAAHNRAMERRKTRTAAVLRGAATRHTHSYRSALSACTGVVRMLFIVARRRRCGAKAEIRGADGQCCRETATTG